MPRLALTSLLIAAGALLPSSARAADSWSYPHPGLALLERTTTTPWRIYALSVDLCARGVSLRATTESERHRTPSSFMSRVGAQAAINGDFFNYTDYFPIGLAVGAGTLWHADNDTMGFIGFGPDHAQLSRTTEVLAAQPWWMREAVGGYPTLVENGVALSSFSPAPDHCSSRHPRTAVGLSHDRQQLWMVVVDGRSSASAGMTCRELAVLMQELGAWTALNFDGGGSSALTIAGRGTLNDPSDGSERSVSNHLAVFASGSGAPGSCDLWLDEVMVDAAAQADDATDLDGDGRADLCARAAAGLRCYPSRGDSFGEAWVIDSLSDASGWDDETNFSTLRFGDITGDGLADVCARGDAQVYCWPSTGSGFGAYLAGPALSDDAGWNRIDRFSTLRLSDFNGDGRDDLCGRDAAGWRCWPSTGSGFGEPVTGPEWSDASGWANPQYYGTIRTGDIDGDLKEDVCARAAAGMRCALSTGAGFGPSFVGPEWSNDAGFAEVEHWSTIRLADLDADGRADLCARGPDGVVCHLSTGAGFGPAIAGPSLSDASGWADMDNASTLRFADIDGDRDLDLCARANVGVLCWPWTGAGFGEPIVGPAWSEESGWSDFRHYATLQLGDLDGDGRADLCGRGPGGVVCHRSEGTGFGPEIAGPVLSDASGWAGFKYFSTLRFGGPRPVPCSRNEELCNGTDDDCDGTVDEGCPEPDAGNPPDPVEDAGQPIEEDGGAPSEDAGETADSGEAPDGGAPDASADGVGFSAVGGCGCGAPGSAQAFTGLLVLALGALAAGGRRARR